jgi:RimJ/RimL family protein N-acetyltransferase
MSNDQSDGVQDAARPSIAGIPYEACDIHTERLLLRPLTANDLDDVHSYQKREDVVRYMHWEVHDHEESAKHLRKRMAMTRLAEDGDGLIYAIELPDPAGGHGRVIGDLSMFLKSIEHGRIEIGWVLHPAAHGRGYATEAAQAVLDLAFETIGAHRVYAELDARNEASARLCERLGMQREALFRKNELLKGEWIDTAVYGIVSTDYVTAAS